MGGELRAVNYGPLNYGGELRAVNDGRLKDGRLTGLRAVNLRADLRVVELRQVRRGIGRVQ
jgi:hypothetical protein